MRKLAAFIRWLGVDEFIRKNADPIWLHQNELWEYMRESDEDWW
jgi:hypothetical protein